MYRCTDCGGTDGFRVTPNAIDSRFAAGYCLDCSTHRLWKRDSGDAAKAAGMAAVEQSAGQGVDAAWQQEAERVVRRLAASAGTFTVDDVTNPEGGAGMPTRAHRNAVGALMGRLWRSGLIEPTGEYVKSSARVEQHARRVTVWRGRRAA